MERKLKATMWCAKEEGNVTTLLLSCPHLSPSPIAFCARHQSLNGTITKSFKGHWVELQVLGVSPNSYDGLSYIYFFTGRRERFILTKFIKKKPFGLIICEPTISFYISFSLRSSGASREADV